MASTASATVPSWEEMAASERRYEQFQREHQPVLDRYYTEMQRIEEAEKRRDFDEAINLSLQTLDTIEDFVEAWRQESLWVYDGSPPSDWFRIKSIPAVELLSRLGVVRLDPSLLDRAEAALQKRPELSTWLEEMPDSRRRLQIAKGIFEAIAAEPGIRQSGLGKRLGVDGNEVRSILYWAEADRRVERRKAGSTYELFLPDAVPPSEALSAVSGGIQYPADERIAAKPSRERSKRSSPELATPPGAEAVAALKAGVFAALDFETATFERASACAVSVTLVDDGQLSALRSWLIQPPDNRYDGWNTMLHGIGPEDTAAAAGFEEVFPEVLAFVGDRPAVAHYAAFDLGVVRAEYQRLGRPWPALTIGCSVVMSRRAWPGLLSYSLPMVADFLGLNPFTHHDPAADASTCAEIVRRVLVATEADTLEGATGKLGVGLGRLEPESYRPCRALFSGKWEFEQPDACDLDPDHPFADADVAFTGTLLSMTRREAAQLVVNAGGRFSQGVTTKTEYLVFGEQDFRKFVDGEQSGKTRRAKELMDDGHHIQIISEGEFLRMLG